MMADGPQTCAELAYAAATYLAQYAAVTRTRSPTARERKAAIKAERVMQDYSIPVPASLAE